MGTLDTKLRNDLERIEAVFANAAWLNQSPGPAEIRRYYHAALGGYRCFHNREGFIHMGLSATPRFCRDDLRASANLIAELIEAGRIQRVLELAPGVGANSVYLARRYPRIQFEGLDLSFSAPLASRPPRNYQQRSGDYHVLDRFEPRRFDIVFIVEALCYSTRKQDVLRAVSRVLRPGGVFVILDGYARVDRARMNADQQRAALLADRSMAVDRLASLNEFRATIRRSDFTVLNEVDYSRATMPSLIRFYRLARAFFFAAPLARLCTKILPRALTQNAMAGLLLRRLVETETYCYYLHVLKKTERR